MNHRSFPLQSHTPCALRSPRPFHLIPLPLSLVRRRRRGLLATTQPNRVSTYKCLSSQLKKRNTNIGGLIDHSPSPSLRPGHTTGDHGGCNDDDKEHDNDHSRPRAAAKLAPSPRHHRVLFWAWIEVLVWRVLVLEVWELLVRVRGPTPL